MSSVRILVTGATGYVGSRLVSALLDQGYDVVAATRNPDRLADFGWHDQVFGVQLDAHDEASTEKAFADGFGHGETARSRIDSVKPQKENIARKSHAEILVGNEEPSGLRLIPGACLNKSRKSWALSERGLPF